MLASIVEHQAGTPVLIKPFGGNSGDQHEVRQVIHAHIS
jgi:transposase